jgi:hypothetical protein
LQFELVEVRVISIFFEFGGGCIHYNFTAKQTEGHLSADASITKLFFSEVDPRFRNENDVLLCCIVGENDAGTNLVTWGSSIIVFLIPCFLPFPLFFVRFASDAIF